LTADGTFPPAPVDVPPSPDAIALAVARETERCARACEVIDFVPHPAEMCAMNTWESLSWGRRVAAAKIRGIPEPSTATKLPPTVIATPGAKV
jgi:hypothetical protein